VEYVFFSQLLYISCFWHYVLLNCEECINAVIIHLISRVTGQHLFFNSKDFLFYLIKIVLAVNFQPSYIMNLLYFSVVTILTHLIV